MKALSIKQPWASLIIEGIKDIENRSWKTSFRGTVLIHASGKGYANLKGDMLVHSVFTGEQWDKIKDKFGLYFFDKYPLSAILGTVDIVDCVVNHPSIWAEKTGLNFDDSITYNWVLSNPVKFEQPILNVKGKLSLWEYPINEK